MVNRKFSWDFNALKRFYDRYVVKWLHSDMDWDDNVKRQARKNLGVHSAGGSLGVYTLIHNTSAPFDGRLRYIIPYDWDADSHSQRLVLRLEGDWSEEEKWVLVLAEGATPTTPTDSFILPIDGTITAGSYIDVARTGDRVKAVVMDEAPDLSNYYTKTETDTRLNQKINTSEKGANDGVCPLESDGMVDTTYLHTGVPYGVPYLTGKGRIPADLTAWIGTRAQYDALETKDYDVIYLIY